MENRDVGAQFSAAWQTDCEAHPVTNSFDTVDEMHGAEHAPSSRAEARKCEKLHFYDNTSLHDRRIFKCGDNLIIAYQSADFHDDWCERNSTRLLNYRHLFSTINNIKIVVAVNLNGNYIRGTSLKSVKLCLSKILMIEMNLSYVESSSSYLIENTVCCN